MKIFVVLGSGAGPEPHHFPVHILSNFNPEKLLKNK
jgi:hypothetical protein